MIPDDILNRVKQPFASGAGSAQVTKMVGQRAASAVKNVPAQARSGMKLKSEAEAYYYQVFKEKFPEDSFEKLVTRWDPLVRQ